MSEKKMDKEEVICMVNKMLELDIDHEQRDIFDALKTDKHEMASYISKMLGECFKQHNFATSNMLKLVWEGDLSITHKVFCMYLIGQIRGYMDAKEALSEGEITDYLDGI